MNHTEKAQYSVDSSKILSCDDHHNLRIWNAKDENCLWLFPAFKHHQEHPQFVDNDTKVFHHCTIDKKQRIFDISGIKSPNPLNSNGVATDFFITSDGS